MLCQEASFEHTEDGLHTFTTEKWGLLMALMQDPSTGSRQFGSLPGKEETREEQISMCMCVCKSVCLPVCLCVYLIREAMHRVNIFINVERGILF